MSHTYIQAIGLGFPNVQCHAEGDGAVYSNIIWDGGAPLPSQVTLNQWIAANPENVGIVLPRYEFRKLFTLNERVAIDNVQTNPTISTQHKAILFTISKDLDTATEVQLYNPDVISGVGLLEQVGLIAPGRAAQILTNQTPV
jgi:hypothetical protein